MALASVSRCTMPNRMSATISVASAAGTRVVSMVIRRRQPNCHWSQRPARIWPSVLLLVVFSTVNTSLVVVKRRQLDASEIFQVPMLIPILGGLTSLILIGFLPQQSLLTAFGIIAFGCVLFTLRKIRGKTN